MRFERSGGIRFRLCVRVGANFGDLRLRLGRLLVRVGLPGFDLVWFRRLRGLRRNINDRLGLSKLLVREVSANSQHGCDRHYEEYWIGALLWLLAPTRQGNSLS